MGLTPEQITAKNFKEFYDRIYPFLNGAAHSGFTPIGTIIAVMGKTSPQNYLACQGQSVNIADFPELADYFEAQFGSKNYFGGDGATTFAVPDLRGEFLRGTGNNSHVSGDNGSDVGVHQAPSEVPASMWIDSTNKVAYPKVSVSSSPDNPLNGVNVTSRTNAVGLKVNGEVGLTNQTLRYYAVRPTNTSVLYCIAAKDIYVDARYDYSLKEKVVGTWIDGKPLYQRTYKTALPEITDGTQRLTNIDISDIPYDFIRVVGGVAKTESTFTSINDAWTVDGVTYFLRSQVYTPNNIIQVISNRAFFSNAEAWVTIRYTKTTDSA